MPPANGWHKGRGILMTNDDRKHMLFCAVLGGLMANPLRYAQLWFLYRFCGWPHDWLTAKNINKARRMTDDIWPV